MLERTKRLRARCIPAHNLAVRELAARDATVGAIPAERHIWMSEGAGRIRAIGEEFAVDFLFEVLGSLCGRWMAAGALPILAGGAEGAGVC